MDIENIEMHQLEYGQELVAEYNALASEMNSHTEDAELNKLNAELSRVMNEIKHLQIHFNNESAAHKRAENNKEFFRRHVEALEHAKHMQHHIITHQDAHMFDARHEYSELIERIKRHFEEIAKHYEAIKKQHELLLQQEEQNIHRHDPIPRPYPGGRSGLPSDE